MDTPLRSEDDVGHCSLRRYALDKVRLKIVTRQPLVEDAAVAPCTCVPGE